MHLRTPVWRLICFGLIATQLGCAGMNSKPDGPMVDSLKIDGTQDIPPRQLKKKILTSASSVFPVWLQWLPLVGTDEYFDVNAWQADLRRIERYYQSEGYYQAKVLDDDVVPTKPGHVALEVKLKEGTPTKVTELAMVGLEQLEKNHREQASQKLPVKVGDIFREADWAQAKQTIVARLQELGYAEATVEGEAVVDLEKGTAALTLEATPGIRYKFGEVRIADAPGAQVPQKWIVEQAENAIKAGDWYSESALSEAQTLVFQMGVFGAVKVNRAAPDRAQGTVPVVVDVREAPFRSARLGPGLGVDGIRQEVRVVGEFTHRNFLGGLRKFSVRGKLGWAFLPTVWDVAGGGANLPPGRATPQQGLVARIINEFEQPRFLGARNLTGIVSLEFSRGLEPAYNFVGSTLKAGVIWRPFSTLMIFPSYNLDVYFLGSKIPLGSQAPEVLFGCNELCIISYLDQTIEWDRRDSKLEPKTGTFVGLSLQEGGLGGQFTFLRIQPELRGYISFGEEKTVTLAAKLKVGTLLSFSQNEESPIIARFFSGGSAMRGFSSRRLSPLIVVPRSNPPPLDPSKPIADQDLSGETLPFGGKGLVEASVELRWNVWGDLMLALFSDSGMVTWESLGKSKNPFQYFYTAVGIGARYRTPLGPIRVDFAVRLPVGAPQQINPTGDLNPDARAIIYPKSGGCFGLGNVSENWGGSPEGICAFHLSIGEAF